MIEWAGTYDSVIHMLHIRNPGPEIFDLSGRALAGGSCSADGDAPLTLIRGSFDLAPGETALIITHPDVPTDDEPRRAYANVYLRSGSTLTTDADLTLNDPTAVRPDVPTGPIEASAAVGECCIAQSNTESCFSMFPPCDGNSSGCWVLVTKSACCNVFNACGWHKSDYGGGCVNGCPNSVTWDCCP